MENKTNGFNGSGNKGDGGAGGGPGAIPKSTSVSSSNSFSNLNLYPKEFRDESALEIVQSKFKRGETVLSLLEAYQILGSESPNRLLALVSATGTYGIFSFATTRLPPTTFSDLTIDNIYTINDDFQLVSDVKGKISKLQFDIITTCTRTVFYYYYSSLNEFSIFHMDVQKAQIDYNNRKIALSNNYDFKTVDDLIDTATATVVVPLELHDRPAANDPAKIIDKISFAWQESYRIRGDYTAIDRNIADGTKPLKRGESKFQDELKKHEHVYIVHKKYRVYCATWNINGQPCNDIPLRNWLSMSDEPPDIYAVALQEMDLSPKAVTFSESRPDRIWIRKIMDNLHPDAKYDELISVRLVGMMLTICVKKQLRQNITRYSIQSLGTGALNFMGNKGGVAVSLTLNESTICFVNSHLAAHLSEVERRNKDFTEIISKIIFDENIRRTIEDHDQIFWIGDLNYRITEYPGIPLDYTNFKELFKYDQLRREIAEYNVFKGFTEGEINFQPTYKYDPGTDNWDSSEKNRAPAWCDRILWKGDRIEQLQYNSVMDVRLSDHKPVYAIFLAGIKTKDEKIYKRIHEEALKRVDKYENDNQPQITVEKTDIDFDIINFNEPLIRDFTVANNCHLPVKFWFQPKDKMDKKDHQKKYDNYNNWDGGGNENKKICEDWITVEPESGNLITGTSLSIRIKLTIDSKYVSQLHDKQNGNTGKFPLDILVLHVDAGRDIFITILGEYKPSCFGFSVDTLCRTNRPISDYNLTQLYEIEKSIDITQCIVTMPREIFLLIDYLYNNTKNISGPLFTNDRKYYLNPNINQIRDWLDTWSSFDFPGTPHTAAETLLMILESGPVPLLHPFEDAFIKSDNFENCLSLLNRLTTPRKNVFLHLTMYLKEIIEQKLMNPNDIASIFGNIVLRGHKAHRLRDDRCKLFMSRFLRNDFTNFAKNQITFK